ncbi:Satratoxin biosynthesis SC1 cluster protein 4 [Colletotrichum spinosum]|uniref:Satratoxin biosynthesis SC1 cluster protein 4 n=1 Tax=Colletotrichum spinosum TaxID=1347390 RepID=A0A4R8PN40_9PEZI|nr:Satratoxin biosynthesis SC1 cluster protein 4 [Colletotrichum spinosum]
MGWTYGAPDDIPTIGPSIAAVTITITSIAFVLVCLRWYVRTAVVKAVGYDDWVIIVSWIGACGYTTCSVIQTRWGLGLTRLEDMPAENVLQFGKLQYIGGPFYVMGIWGFKMSLLFSYLRFFPRGAYRNITIAIAVACTMGHIAFVCVFLFLCTPIEKQYDPNIPADVGSCVDAIAFYLTFSSLTIVFDVVIMLLPFPLILKSQIQRRKKVVLLSLFVLGVFITVIQALRIQTIRNLVNYLDSARTIQWSIIETDIGIIIACVPTLAPLVKFFAERTRSGTNGGASGGQKPGSRYALQTWRTGRSGMQPLSAGVDRHTSISASRTTKPDDSTENILGPPGITKRTEVQVTTARERWDEAEDKDVDRRA